MADLVNDLINQNCLENPLLGFSILNTNTYSIPRYIKRDFEKGFKTIKSIGNKDSAYGHSFQL